MYSAVVFGHSFVTGLRDSLAYRCGLESGEYLGHYRPVSELRVDNHFHSVTFLGRSGLTIEEINNFQPILSNLKPDIFVVDVGSNDLVSTAPFTAATLLIDTLINNIIPLWNPKHVAICSALYRSHNCTPLTPDNFNKRCFDFNGYVRDMHSQPSTFLSLTQRILECTHIYLVK